MRHNQFFASFAQIPLWATGTCLVPIVNTLLRTRLGLPTPKCFPFFFLLRAGIDGLLSSLALQKLAVMCQKEMQRRAILLRKQSKEVAQRAKKMAREVRLPHGLAKQGTKSNHHNFQMAVWWRKHDKEQRAALKKRAAEGSLQRQLALNLFFWVDMRLGS